MRLSYNYILFFFFCSSGLFASGGEGFSKSLNFGIKRFSGSIYTFGKGYSGIASFQKFVVNPLNSATWAFNSLTLFDFSLETSSSNVNLANGIKALFSSASFGGVSWISQIVDSTITIGMTLSPYLERRGRFLENQTVELDTLSSDVMFSRVHSGVISELKFSTSYRISNVLALSTDLLYYFGSQHVEEKFVENTSTLFFRSNDSKESDYYGMTLGLNAYYRINKTFSVGIQYSFSKKLQRNSKGIFSSVGNIDNYEIKEGGEIYIPAKFNVGVSKTFIGFGKLSFDLRTENWKKPYEAVKGIHFGYESFSSLNPFASFWDRTTFYSGAFYYNEPFKYHFNNNISPEPVYVFGITSGVSIPFNGVNSVSFGISYQKRGSNIKNGVEENIFSLNIGISLGELWYFPDAED